MHRIILTGPKAREELTKGADILADAVKSTLGPFGQNFFLDKKNTITNDGVKIASEIQLKEEIQNRGATALREAALKTNDEAGDGTTTAIVLAQAIYKSASRFLSKDNVIGKRTPAEVIRQIEKERLEITEKLQAMATPIESEEQLTKSAIVSVEDEDLGKLVASAQWKLGPNGYLIAEETAERTSSVDFVKGIRIDNGAGTSQIFNNPEKQSLELENCAILLTSHTIRGVSEWNHIMRILQDLAKAGYTEVVIVARAWTDETVSYCLQNITKGSVKPYPLSAPYTDMTERMKDLAAVTGANFYDAENSTLDDVMLTGLGRVQKVVAKRMEAILTGVDNEKTTQAVQARIDELTKQITGSQSEFEKKGLSERLAQLQNGFAIIKVGSVSDMERHRLYDKVEDAVHAVRAAYQEGTVPGAGLAFKQIAETLPDDYLLKRALMAPYEQIMSSAPEGFTIEPWVRDPLKVMRIALQKACTAASSFATAGGVITVETSKPLDVLFRKAITEQQ